VGQINRPVMERKIAALQTFISDLGHYAELDPTARRREHYAIERLLQLLCETAADIGLQLLKMHAEHTPAASYREVFERLREHADLPEEMANQLISACGMRNVLTNLYDTIDLDRVMAAAGPAVKLYRDYLGWVLERLDQKPPGR